MAGQVANNGRMSDGPRLRVILLEDDAFTLMTLAALIRSLGHEVVGEASTIVDAIDSGRQHHPDVAVLDLDLGVGPTGIDAAHGLRVVNAEIGIVLLSSYAEPRLMGKRARPLPPGSQFLSKQDLGDSAILDATMRASLEREASGVHPTQAVDLTESQIEIMRLVASGLSNEEIARRMWLTESGVKRAITRLLRKLDLEVTKDLNARVLLTRAYGELAGRATSDG